MTVEQKKARKHRRCQKRRAKNERKNQYILNIVYEYGVTFSQAKHLREHGAAMINGQYKQICSYKGLCTAPCNGDC